MPTRRDVFIAETSPAETSSATIHLLSHFTATIDKLTAPIDRDDLMQAGALITELTMSQHERELSLKEENSKVRSQVMRFWISFKSILRDKAKDILLMNFDHYAAAYDTEAVEMLHDLKDAIFAHTGSTLFLPPSQAKKLAEAVKQGDPDGEVDTKDLNAIAKAERISLHILDMLERIQLKELPNSNLTLVHIKFLVTQLEEVEPDAYFSERERWAQFAHIFYNSILSATTAQEAYAATELYLYLTDYDSLQSLLTYLALSQSIDEPIHQSRISGIRQALEYNQVYTESFMLERGMLVPRAIGQLLVEIALIRKDVKTEEQLSEADRQIAARVRLFTSRNYFDDAALQNVQFILDAMLPVEYQNARRALFEAGGETAEV